VAYNMKLFTSIFLLSSALMSYGQDLISALTPYPQLSQFVSLLHEHPEYLSIISNSSSNLTVLASTNDAFISYELATGQSIHSLNGTDVLNILLYQTFNESYYLANYEVPDGTLATTLLTNEAYDQRKTSPTGQKPGQVVYISNGNYSIVSRQLSTNFVESGIGKQITVGPLEGVFRQGTFQVIDG
jgi:hypothetical protein